VRLATAAYETTEDHIGRFLSECCMRQGPDTGDLRVEQGLLYATYTGWCSSEGIRADTPRAFAGRIRQEIGLASPAEMLKSSGKKYYPALALLPDDLVRPDGPAGRRP
jgi:putative DNA primase/helicase